MRDLQLTEKFLFHVKRQIEKNKTYEETLKSHEKAIRQGAITNIIISLTLLVQLLTILLKG